MILRRVIEHFRRQEWTAIAIDFVIVVMGVFLGVQVNVWWQGQADGRREIAYLSALREDFGAIIAELDEDAAAYGETAAAMSFLLEESRKPAPEAPLEALNAAAGRLIEMEGMPIASGAYDNLVGSGDLALIRSEKVRNALSSFYGEVEVVKLVGTTHEAQLVNIFQPYIVAHLDYVGMLSRERDVAPVAGFDQGRILIALPTAEFRNVVAVKWDIVTDIRNIALRALAGAREVDALLAEELETLQ